MIDVSASVPVVTNPAVASDDPDKVLPRRSLPRPATHLYILLFLWSISGLLPGFHIISVLLWLTGSAAIWLVMLADLIQLYRIMPPQVKRLFPETLALHATRPVTLQLTSSSVQHLDLQDEYPAHWQMTGLPLTLDIAPAQITTVTYNLTPTRRGDADFGWVHVRLRSPLGLWQQRVEAGQPQSVRVFPDFVPLTRFALLTASQASRLIGVHQQRRRGEGTEFDQLRDYRTGDSLRQIDWKATARLHRPISREYQDERHQQVMILLDSGRRMLAQDGDIGHFDQALDALLVVAYLALRQGDSVGLQVAGGMHRWVPPQRGAAVIETLLQASYDLQPQPVATDYVAAASELLRLQPRRSLLLWITNVRDEDSDDLLLAAHLLKRHHRLIIVSLRETVLDQVLQQPVHTLSQAVLAGATADYLNQREQLQRQMQHQGIPMLDTTCRHLPALLVSEYLKIRSSGVI